MKRSYRRQDLPIAIEEKKKALHQIEQIEMHLWTDNIDEAIKRTVDLHLALINLNRLQSSKRLEELFSQMDAKGVQVRIINFKHKKTD